MENMEWIEWGGGECPVDPETIIYVALDNETPIMGDAFRDKAGNMAWDHVEYGGNITAYRVVS